MAKGTFAAILRWQGRLETFFLILSACAVTCLLVLTIADVGGRYLFNQPISGVYEFLILLVPGLGFLPLAYLQRIQEQISVKFVVERLPLNLQKRLNKATLAVSLLTMSLVLAASASTAINTWVVGEMTTGIVAYPLGPPMIVIPISVCLFCVRVVLQLIHPPESAPDEELKISPE